MIFYWADGKGGRREIEIQGGGGSTYDDFVGATPDKAGEHGLVPKPEAGQQNKVLYGSGSWAPFLLDDEPSILEGAMWLSTVAGGSSATISGQTAYGLQVAGDEEITAMLNSVWAGGGSSAISGGGSAIFNLQIATNAEIAAMLNAVYGGSPV